MITLGTVVIGNRVKNTFEGASYYGKTGTVESTNDIHFIIRYECGSICWYCWVNRSTWFDIIANSIDYRPATNDDIKVGTKLRCIYSDLHNIWFGRTATIILVTNVIGGFEVAWDDGIGGGGWYDIARNFEVLISSVKSRRKPKQKKIIPDIPLDPDLHVLQAGYLQDRQRKQFR